MAASCARHYVTALPKVEHDKPHWQTAAHELMMAAERGGILMPVEVAMRQALAHGSAETRTCASQEGRQEMTVQIGTIGMRSGVPVAQGHPAEYKAGLDHVAKGWLVLHESGTFVKLTDASATVIT